MRSLAGLGALVTVAILGFGCDSDSALGIGAQTGRSETHRNRNDADAHEQALAQPKSTHRNSSLSIP